MSNNDRVLGKVLRGFGESGHNQSLKRAPPPPTVTLNCTKEPDQVCYRFKAPWDGAASMTRPNSTSGDAPEDEI